jgi:hypothetical protein
MIKKAFKSGLAKGPVVLIFCLVLAGCTCESPKTARQGNLSVDISGELADDLMRIRQIFYSLPSPVESAMLLKSSGAIYDEELLNPVENVSKYMTNKSMALNLGIYTTNLSYASLFDQAQTSIRYMSVARRLADNLGILDVIDGDTMDKLEKNITDRDVIMDIVSETFMNSSSFLQENNREPVAAILLAGGWVEGIYLAVNLVDENDLENSTLAKRIIDNKLSLDILMLLLEENSHNHDVSDVIDVMEEIYSVFQQIEIQSTPIKVTRVPGESVTIISSQTTTSMTREVFNQLKSTITTIRNNFIS